MTLDQLLAFEAIVDTGTFRAASDRLNKAQSAVSHLIRKLEDELQFNLFSRDTYRPTLTEEGVIFHRETLRLLQQYRHLRTTAKALISDEEPVVRIAVAATFALDPVLDLLKRIGGLYPRTHLRVTSENMGGPLARLMDGDADMIVSGLDGVPLDQVDTVTVGSVVIQPVAHRDSPFAGMPGMRSRMEMQTRVQIVVAGTGGTDFDQSRDVMTTAQRWTVSDFATKKSMIMAGLGWGGMPTHLIEAELADGSLVPLSVEGFPPRHTEIFAVKRRDHLLGPVGTAIWTGLHELQAKSENRQN